MPKRGLRVAAVVWLCLFSACEYMGPYRPPWLINDDSNSRRTYSSSYRYRHTRSQRARVAQTRAAPRDSIASGTHDEAAGVERVAIERPVPAPAVAPAPEANLSLAGDVSDRQRALNLLARTSDELTRARAHALTKAQRENYERARQLASRARRALAEDDCAAASSLALKASSLAAGINE